MRSRAKSLLEGKSRTALAVAKLARNTSLDLTLTTQGVLLGASYMVRHSTELGVGVKLGEGDLTARPYLAVVLVL